MKTKHLVFFGAMSSILLIGTANADTHVSTKGYADRHVAGAEGAVATSANDKQLIQIRNVGTDTEPIMKYVFANMPSAGSGITIDENNEISVTDRYKAGTNVTFGTADGNGVKPINAVDTTSVAGDNSVNIVAGTGANAGKQVVTVKHDDTLTVTDSGLHVNVTDADTQYDGDNVTVKIDGTTVKGIYSGTAPVTVDNSTGKITVATAGQNSLGVVKGGTNVTIGSDGSVNATDTIYTQGTNVTIDANNKISATDTKYTSGNATTVTDNGPIDVEVDNSTIKINTDNQLYAPVATGSALGVVKVGDNLSIESDGKLNATDTKYNSGAATTIDTDNKINVDVDDATIVIDNDKLKAVAMVGATANNDGVAGIVPKPMAEDKDKVLSGAGTWVAQTVDTNTTYNSGVATTIDGSNNVNVDVDGTTIVTTGDKLSVPIATTDAVGVVKVGNNLSIDANGKLDATDTKYYAGDRVTLDTTSNKFSANLATATTAGAVLPDGSTINLNASDGKISVPTATPSSYGIVKYDNDTITTNEAGQLKAKQAQYVSHVDTSGNHLDKTGTSISAGIDGIIPAPTNYYSFYAGSGDWVEPTTIINWTLPNKCRVPNIRCSLTSYAGNDGKAYMRWEPLTNTYYNDDGTDTMPTNVNDDSSFPAPPAVR